MSEFVKTLLSLSVSGSLLTVALLCLKPLYRERFSKRWQYYIWLIVVLRFLLPFTPETALMNRMFVSAETAVQSEVSGNGETAEDSALENPAYTGELDSAASTVSPRGSVDTVSIRDVAGQSEALGNFEVWAGPGMFVVWAFGAALLFCRKLVSYRRFTYCLWSESTESGTEEEQKLLDACMKTMYIKRRIKLCRSTYISSPVLLEFGKPVIVLPLGEIPAETLELVFRHELIHYRRRDALYKWLVQLAMCIHWFNPVVYLVGKEVGRSCELSCDEAVLSGLPRGEKRKYGDMLLAFAKAGKGCQNSFVSVILTEGAEHLKERLGAVMRFKKSTKAAVIGPVFALCVLLLGAVYTGAYIGMPDGENTGEAPAEESDARKSRIDAEIQASLAEDQEGDPAVSVPAETHLELVHMEEAYPWFLLEFQILEGGTKEARTFENPSPPDVTLEQGGERRSGYWTYLRETTDTALIAQNKSDGFVISFWSTGDESATISAEGLPYTVELPTEELETITMDQRMEFLSENAAIDTALVYPKGFVLNFSGISYETIQRTAFILAEEGSEYDEYLEGFVGNNSYDEGTETYTQSFAFPEGFPEGKNLVLRVIKLDRNGQESRDYADYPLHFL